LTPSYEVSIVVPVYNGSATITALADRIFAAFPLTSLPELIFVDDGSADTSWQTIESICITYPMYVRGLRMTRNFGQHNALLCGVRAARGRNIVTMDDDLQHRPEDIPLLLERLASGADVVYGTPFERPHAPWRNATSAVSKFLLARVIGIRTIQDISAFRAFRSSLRAAFSRYDAPDVFLDVLLSWGTTRFAAVTVQHDPRRVGRSGYTLWRLLGNVLLILTGYSTAPLRVTSAIGFAFTFSGLAILVYVLVVFLTVKSIPGFPFLASMIAIFSGAQLFSLGMMGEYIARIYNRSMERPTYVLGATVGFDPDAVESTSL
jgi:glycosyltransferase involved in cell wall biosynthesis